MLRFAAVSLLLGCSLHTFTAGAAAETKILLIGKDRDHPPRTHEYMSVCKLLATCLEQTSGVTTVVSNGWPKDEAMLNDVKAIVIYTAVGGDMLLKGPHRSRFEEMMKKGVGFSAIHWGTGAGLGEVGETYLRILGGWFSRHFALIPVVNSKLEQADSDHPIARGWQPFDLRDEYYIFLRFLPTTQHVMSAEVQGRSHTVGWAYERTRPYKGRSFGTVIGHFHDNFGIPSFRKALINGILWTAGVDVPPDGAPCKVTAKDLELPPDPREKK